MKRKTYKINKPCRKILRYSDYTYIVCEDDPWGDDRLLYINNIFRKFSISRKNYKRFPNDFIIVRDDNGFVDYNEEDII